MYPFSATEFPLRRQAFLADPSDPTPPSPPKMFPGGAGLSGERYVNPHSAPCGIVVAHACLQLFLMCQPAILNVGGWGAECLPAEIAV